MQLRTLFFAVAILLAALAPRPLFAAITFSFSQITSNGAPASAAQYSVTVFDNADIGLAAGLSPSLLGLGTNQVGFLFRNVGPVASSITDVYFDDGALLGIATVHNGPGVDYSVGATPANLPSANTPNPDFETSSGNFSADSDSPRQPNGINNSGEKLAIVFNLKANQTYADVIAALNAGLSLNPGIDADSQGVNLRIGIKVQGFDNGASESFINGPPSQQVPPPTVPEPATWLVWSALSGLMSFGMRCRPRASGRAKG